MLMATAQPRVCSHSVGPERERDVQTQTEKDVGFKREESTKDSQNKGRREGRREKIRREEKA